MWTILYNHVYDNGVMYHESRHELYYTGNTYIIELNSIINGTCETKYFEICVAQYQLTQVHVILTWPS